MISELKISWITSQHPISFPLDNMHRKKAFIVMSNQIFLFQENFTRNKFQSYQMIEKFQ